ncbi:MULTISPECIES: DUF2480 family protein [unclassified Tenacibaculum]|uniref:DUF2480 family protein n=1 Tax=unclassified Tenacibaculum TaxID=2635139 RepID=UPI001F30B4BE|nr:MULTISPECIES: DUF2480 family protein [unclassified Tenacibaculum]MCF2875892.1 DUF2480 family protein [Tenacibaculum sp. Cn5-1]MCF2935967.1 DUF2480 family protein [Tenacibaculum sp. Cn5-34]MCG7512528.1 DUF2480 family protein [Tenacibaculum sp. Cn5-46]
MAEEIINRVANSKLITIDLEDFYPQGRRVVFDIKDWLYEGLILREKDFREQVKNHNWEQYQNTYVALTCSSDAIIPSWAHLLLTAQLSEHTNKVVVGNLELLETVIYQEIINSLDISEYEGKPIIIKGCANKPIPPSAYTLLIEKIQPIAKTLMFGEACSTVPLYKKKR